MTSLPRQVPRGLVLLALITASSCSYAVRVSSSNTPGVQPDGRSIDPVMSNDGRLVAFASDAENLVDGDANGVKDIFVRDNEAGVTTLVSAANGGGEANGVSGQPDMSANGRYVVYWSFADNLVANDMNGTSDVFVHDRQAGTTERVSIDSTGNEGQGGSLGGSVSDDGRMVAFYTTAPLDPADTNGGHDIYVRDRQLGITTLVSTSTTGDAAGSSFDPVIARDGQSVAWSSTATNITSGDTNGYSDVFGKSLTLDTTINFTRTGNGHSYLGDITTGTFPSVTYSSDADNLVAGDTNGVTDVFLEESNGFGYTRSQITHGNDRSWSPVMAVIDPIAGAKVVFLSAADDLQNPGESPPDTNGFSDVYVWERLVFGGSRTRLMSQTITGELLNDASTRRPAVSPNGAAVAYPTRADNVSFGDTNGVEDIYARPVRVPRIDSVTGTLQVGAAATLTLHGEFDPTGSAPDSAYMSGADVVSLTVDDVTYTSITVTIELSSGASVGQRDLWVYDTATQLGIPSPLGSGDRTSVDVTS